jgi:hypothetical protein
VGFLPRILMSDNTFLLSTKNNHFCNNVRGTYIVASVNDEFEHCGYTMVYRASHGKISDKPTTEAILRGINSAKRAFSIISKNRSSIDKKLVDKLSE